MADAQARNLRHELRTPINHIVGYAELLLEEPGIPSDLEAALKRICEMARDSLGTISSIVDEARAVAPDALDSLRATVDGISGAVSEATALANEATRADIARIRDATATLQSLVGDLRTPARAAPNAGAVRADDVAAEAPVVLVVDDDATNRDVLGRRLQRLGYRVVEAENGAKALEVLGEGGVDVVLLDLMMPVVDGLAVLEQRQRDPALLDIPVIMISAQDEVESIARCIELGADDYLAKPFDPVLLQARVGASLQKKRLHDREKHLLATVTRQAEELAAWNTALEERVAEQVREVERLSLMERFVPPQLADVVRAGGVDMLTSHRREIAVLFCDLRGFTPFSETAEPEDVMAVLKDMHDAVGPLIFEQGGTLAQFTGDGMMVFFNDPIPCDEPAWKAVQLGLGMQQETSLLSQVWKARGHALELGVGIAMGYATCGQIGFEGRFEYTAIGTVTNLAARLCAQAAGGQILANERLCQAAGDLVTAEKVGDLELKGLARLTPVFAIEGPATHLK